MIVLTWSPVPGATGYNIYRNIGADGDHGDTRLLAWLTTPTTTYTDNGAVTPNAAEPPLPLGSISPWTTLSSTLVHPREGGDSVKVVVPDGFGGGVPYIYVVGGRINSAVATTYRNDIEIAAIDPDDGTLGPFHVLTHTMQAPRGFFTLLTSQGQNAYVSRGEYFDPDETIHLIAVAGDDIFVNPNNSGLKTFEVARVVDTTGETTDWTLQTIQWNKANHGHEAQLFFGTLFCFLGVNKETLGGNPTPNTGTSPRYAYTATNPLATIINSGQSSSDGPALTTYYQSVRLKSFVFAIGGNDGSGPTNIIGRGY
jgi:hypothetical protein